MRLFKRIFILVIIALAIFWAYATCATGNDFEVFLQAGRQLKDHNNIYTPPFIRGLQYFYSVFFALLLSPVSDYILLTQFLWILLTYFFLIRIGVLISYYFDLSVLTTKQKYAFLFFSLLLSVQFIIYEVDLVQITSFLLWAMLESLKLTRHKNYILAGLILGLAINIKIMPILLFPYLFYRGYFKTIIFSSAVFIILLFLPSIFIGISYNQFLHNEWWKVINPGNKEHLVETEIGPHSLTAWIPVLLMKTVGEFQNKRNIMNLLPSTVEIILNIARLILLSCSVLFLKTFPFKKEENKLKFLWEAAYFIMLVPLIMPHQQKYNFLLISPMIIYLIYFFIRTLSVKKNFLYKIIFIFFLLDMLVFSPLYGADIIGKWYRLTQHYRLLTICTICIIPISLYCNPGRLYKLFTGDNDSILYD